MKDIKANPICMGSRLRTLNAVINPVRALEASRRERNGRRENRGPRHTAMAFVMTLASAAFASSGAHALPSVFDFAALVDDGPAVEGPFAAPYNPWTVGDITLTASATRSDGGVAFSYLDEKSGGKPAGLGVCSIPLGACPGTNDDNTNYGDGSPNTWTETLILSFSDANGDPLEVELDPITFRDSNHNLAVTMVKIDDGGGAVNYGLSSSVLSAPANVVRGTRFAFTPLQFGGDFYISSLTATKVNRQVPEPGTLALFSLGLLGLGAARRHRKQKTNAA